MNRMPAGSARFAPNSAMLMRPDRLPPSAWTGHVPFGAWLVAALQPRLLVELGTHHGTSYLAFCQAMHEQHVEGRCLAVDTWAGDEHAGAYTDEVYDTLRRYHDPLYARFSELLRMTFDEALECVADGTVDLLHIDGLHTYEAVKHDFESWRPKLSDRAVVLFHDIEVRDRGFGVWRFWDEVRAHHPAYQFPHSHGLGVLLVGSQVPQGVRDLASLEGAESAQVQAMFERLGEGLQARSAAEELERALAGREEGLRAYRDQAQALEAHAAGLSEQLQAANEGVQAAIASREDAVGEYREHAEALEKHAHALEKHAHAQEKHVVSLQGRIESMLAELQSLQGQVAQASSDAQQASRAAAEERERMVATFAASTAEMTRRLDESHARALSLTGELDRMVNSRSWRMTAWLRKLASLARGRG